MAKKEKIGFSDLNLLLKITMILLWVGIAFSIIDIVIAFIQGYTGG